MVRCDFGEPECKEVAATIGSSLATGKDLGNTPSAVRVCKAVASASESVGSAEPRSRDSALSP